MNHLNYRHDVRCYFCNRFLSYDEMSGYSVSWTSHGGVESIEPPDEEWAHIECWNKNTNSQKVIAETAWIGPYVQIDKDCEYRHELRQIHRAQKGTSKAV